LKNPNCKGPDALLTPKGIQQALVANAAWKAQISASAPLPQKFLSSPLSRAASTLNFTWSDIAIQTSPFMNPVFVEGLRESIGLHTCDKRRDKYYLKATYPNFTFEAGFSIEDELWGPVYEETFEQQIVRLRPVLDSIWERDTSTYISITAHSGTVNAILANIGHRPFNLQTGGMIPVVVKGCKKVTFLQKR
jgi:broad specificity phosphatase PhoE